MITITIDTEWCPDAVIQDTVSILDDHDINATLFSTHDDGITSSNHERALHPNFLQEEISEQEALENIAEIYPDAVGLRSHSLYIHSRLREHYPAFNIQYESNYMEYLVDDLKPFWMLNGVVQFPIYFMDDMWFRSRKSETSIPDVGEILSGGGLKVFDFHPIHVFLNTTDVEHYRENRENYDDTSALRRARSDGPGVRDLFCALLKQIKNDGMSVCTLGDLAESFANRNPEHEMRI